MQLTFKNSADVYNSGKILNTSAAFHFYNYIAIYDKSTAPILNVDESSALVSATDYSPADPEILGVASVDKVIINLGDAIFSLCCWLYLRIKYISVFDFDCI